MKIKLLTLSSKIENRNHEDIIPGKLTPPTYPSLYYQREKPKTWSQNESSTCKHQTWPILNLPQQHRVLLTFPCLKEQMGSGEYPP